MKKLIIFTVYIITSMKINGQGIEKARTNALSFEVGKTGLIYSIAFDRNQKSNFGFRVTIGTNFSNYLRAFSTFIGSYYLVGKNSSNLELGIDIGYLSVNEKSGTRRDFAFIFPDYSIKTYSINLNIGYRKYWKKSMFRAGSSPSYSKSGPFPGAYISYGRTF